MSIPPIPGRAESIPEPPARVAVAVGSPIAESLDIDAGAVLVAIDGGPALPLDRSRTWSKAGRWLVMVSTDAGQPTWYDVRVGDGAGDGGPAEGEYRVDRTAPLGSLQVEGASTTVSDRLWLGPDATVRAETSDASGVAESSLTLDGEPVSGQVASWPAGPHRLVVVASDRAGNRGEAVVAQVARDDRGPEIDWRIADPGVPGAGGRTIYRSPVTLVVEATDSGAGLARLWQVDGDRDLPSGGRIEVAEDQVVLAAMDTLGNRSEVTARWIVDRDPPVLKMLLDGVEQPPGEVVRVAAGGAVEMRAEDAGLGVAAAEYRVNGEEWKPLSDSLRFVDRGWYQVEIRAEDVQGLTARAFWDVRTGNPRALRPHPRELIDENDE